MKISHENSLRIGIDFDNTVASYDTLFHQVAISEGFIPKNWNGKGKTELRNYLRQELNGESAVMLTSGILRSVMARFVKYTIPGLRVLSYQEIPDDKQIRIVSVIGQQN